MKLPDFVNQSSVDLQNRVSGFFGNEVKQDSLITSIDDLYKNTKTLHDNVVIMEGEVEKDAAQVSDDRVVVEELSARVFDADRTVHIARDETLAARDETVQAVNTAITSANSASSDAAKAKLSEEASSGFAHDAQRFANNALISEEEAKKSFDLSYAIYEDLKKGQVYRGLWNPHTAAYPDNGDTNSVWDVVLNESETEHTWNGIKWFWGDRLVYVKETNEYQQLESGLSGGVISVNGKKGAVQLTAQDVKALPLTGGTMAGNLSLGTYSLMGRNDTTLTRDFGNGNVVLAASKSDAGSVGDLYVGYNGALSGTAGFNTRNVRIESPMNWQNVTPILDADGINSEFFKGPIRTEKDENNVYHTVVGGTDTVNRGRTIIAAGECGKHIADNIATGAEQVHIGGDQNNSVYVHMGLQSGWGTDTHKIAKFEGGELYLGKGTSRVYHEGYKPTAADVGVTNVGMGGGAVNINDVGITDLNRIKTSGHYYTSNATDLNRPSSAAGPVVHVQGAAGYQQYVRDNNIMFRGFTGTDFKPWQTIYHTGYKPSAADVGALPIAGGKLTGSLTIAPALGTNGVSIMQTPNTGTNAIGVHGFTSNGSAIQWGSGVYYAAGNPQYAYFGYGTNPWANGLKVNNNSVYATNLLGTENGLIVANNGRFLCNDPNYPMYEMHIPGKAATAIYTVPSGNMVFCQSNGSGSNAATFLQLNATVADFTGKVVSRYNQSRSWVAQGAAAFSGTESTISSGGLTAVASQIVHITGVAGGIEYGHGYLADGTEINNHGHALFCNNGTNNYNRYWIFRNNGGQQSPSNFRISPDGHMSGNAYEGYEDHFQWSIANLGATTDARMVKAIGRSTAKALDVVDKLQVSKLVWKEEAGAVHTTRDVKVTEFGLVADEVEEVDVTFVKTIRVGGENPTETKTLDTAAMLALAFKAIQELTEANAKLSERVATLETKLSV